MRDFKVRFNDSLRQQKEAAIEQLRQKNQVQQDRLEQKLNNALARLEKEQGDVQTKKTDSLISFGVAVVGVFFGRKSFSATNIGRAATGMRSIGRVAKEKSDVQRVAQDVEEIQNALQELAGQIEDKVRALTDSFSVDNYEIETFALKPRRSDIFDVRMVLLWEMVV
jgi:DNA anti-recombination protein RmuC